jgi:protein-tyrosine phosphatase
VNYSRITEDLFIGTTPDVQAYDRLRGLGVRLVINMRVEHRLRPDPHDPPLSLLWLPSFDSPFVPISIGLLKRGAQAAIEAIHAGGKVYAHCAGGVHRGVAMGAAVLIAQGHLPEDAMRLIRANRPMADPEVFYIRNRILRFARQWQPA